MTHADLDRLVRVAPPPDRPIAARPPDDDGWPEVERRLGLGLPADYREVIEAYGSGTFDEFLFVLSPFSQPGAGLGDFGATMLSTLRDNRAAGIETPYPIHPEAGGLLPWGYTGNGDWCYWVADPPDAPDRWRITLNGSRSPEWWEHPGPLVTFLVDVLSGAVRVPFFPNDFPAADPSFVAAPG